MHIVQTLPDDLKATALESLHQASDKFRNDLQAGDVYDSMDSAENPYSVDDFVPQDIGTGQNNDDVNGREATEFSDDEEYNWDVRQITPVDNPQQNPETPTRPQNNTEDLESLDDVAYRAREPAAFGPCPRCNHQLWRYHCANCGFGE